MFHIDFMIFCIFLFFWGGHFLKKGVFFGFLKFFKTFLESIYELTRGHFYVSY